MPRWGNGFVDDGFRRGRGSKGVKDTFSQIGKRFETYEIHKFVAAKSLINLHEVVSNGLSHLKLSRNPRQELPMR